MGKRVVGFVQVRGAIACRVGVAGTSQDQSFEGYVIEGSPRDAMIAILAKSRENEVSGLRKSWGVYSILFFDGVLAAIQYSLHLAVH